MYELQIYQWVSISYIKLIFIYIKPYIKRSIFSIFQLLKKLNIGLLDTVILSTIIP